MDDRERSDLVTVFYGLHLHGTLYVVARGRTGSFWHLVDPEGTPERRSCTRHDTSAGVPLRGHSDGNAHHCPAADERSDESGQKHRCGPHNRTSGADDARQRNG